VTVKVNSKHNKSGLSFKYLICFILFQPTETYHKFDQNKLGIWDIKKTCQNAFKRKAHEKIW